MNIEFKNDIHKWYEEQIKRTVPPPNTIIIPSSKELFFEAKMKEIHSQYQSARLFLCQIDNDYWEYWYSPYNDEKKDGIIKTGFNSTFLETAILYYNIVVDLTWVLCYVSAEYTCYAKNKSISTEDINEIQITKESINKLESLVSNPFEESNPLNYLKKQLPEFESAIELVYDFWKEFANSEVRSLYNYIKHKGKPQYSELYKYTAKKFYSFHKKDIEYPTDQNDVKREISLYDTVNLLNHFDDEILFNYCDKLVSLLIPLVYR